MTAFPPILQDDEDEDEEDTSGRKTIILSVLGGTHPSMPRLIDTLGADPNHLTTDTGMVRDVRGVWHSLDALPDDLVVPGDLHLQTVDLPPSLVVIGTLTVRSRDALVVCAGIRVGTLRVVGARQVTLKTEIPAIGNFQFVSVREVLLPEDLLVITGQLAVADCGPVTLPKRIVGDVNAYDTVALGVNRIEGDLVVAGTKNVRIQSGARISGDVFLFCRVFLGRDLRIGGNLTAKLNGRTDIEIGEGTVIVGDLDVSGASGKVRIGRKVDVRCETFVAARTIRIDDGCIFDTLLINARKAHVVGSSTCTGPIYCNRAVGEAMSSMARVGALRIDDDHDGEDPEDEFDVDPGMVLPTMLPGLSSSLPYPRRTR